MKVIAVIDKPDCWLDCKMIEYKNTINSYVCHLDSHVVSAEIMEQYCKNMCPLRPLPLRSVWRDDYGDGWNDCLDEITGEK